MGEKNPNRVTKEEFNHLVGEFDRSLSQFDQITQADTTTSNYFPFKRISVFIIKNKVTAKFE